MLFDSSLARHQICSSVNFSRQRSIFGRLVAQQRAQGMIDESSRTVLSGATLDIVVAGDLGPSFVLNARLSTT